MVIALKTIKAINSYDIVACLQNPSPKPFLQQNVYKEKLITLGKISPSNCLAMRRGWKEHLHPSPIVGNAGCLNPILIEDGVGERVGNQPYRF